MIKSEENDVSRLHVRREDIIYYQHLIDVVSNGIICTDIQASIVFVNQTALDMLGYSSEELLGRPFEVIFVMEDRDLCCSRVVEDTLDHGSYEGEFLFERRDGNHFPGQLSSSCLREDDGIKDIVFVINDLTEQKKLQQNFMNSQKMASLGKVIEGISHEIRNPIVSLGGYTRRLIRTLEPDHLGQSFLQIILEDVQRMEDMLQDINNYVSFAKKYQAFFKKVDLHGIIKDALQSLRLPINVKLEETYPTENPWIYGDTSHLRELFLHLLENAMEAMPEGGVLRLILKQEDSNALVEIEDTGVGIANADLPHIFNPFFSTKTKSVGVGLAKAYIIVEEHKGEIEVKSNMSKGTTFMLSFPLDRRQRARRDEKLLMRPLDNNDRG